MKRCRILRAMLAFVLCLLLSGCGSSGDLETERGVASPEGQLDSELQRAADAGLLPED